MKRKSIVIGHDPGTAFPIFDSRFNPPFIAKYQDSDVDLLLQEYDVTKCANVDVMYFTPNQVAICLSVAAKYSMDSLDLYKQIRIKSKEGFSKENGTIDKQKLIMNSQSVIDFFEKIQIGIVFGVMAVETFVNLSIPSDYIYKKKTNKCVENYNKEQIERFINLKEKISTILVDIYQTPKISDEKWWSEFCDLVETRNSIVHQKSSRDTEQLSKLLESRVFNLSRSSLDVIEFFHKNTIKNKQGAFVGNEMLWPIIDPENVPIIYMPNAEIERSIRK